MNPPKEGQAAIPTPQARRRWSQLLRLTLGLALGSGGLWLASRGVNWAELCAALIDVDLRWLGMSLGCVGLSLAVLTTRWQMLFYPLHRERRWFGLFRSLVVGQALNVVAPGRIGEVTRVFAVGAEEDITKAQVLGTIVVEKVMDMAALMIAIFSLGHTILPPSWMIGVGHALMGITAIATVALLFVAYGHKVTLRWIEWVGRYLPQRMGNAGEKYGRPFLAGFGAIRYRRIHAALWLLSFLLLALSVLTNYFLFKAFGLTLSVGAALFLLVVLQVGNAPPSLPGKLGVFHYLTVVALTTFLVDRNKALAYSAVLYSVAILSKIALAGLLTVFAPRSIRAGDR